MAENIDFQFPMKKSCGADIVRFCKDVQHGHAKTIRCLQDNLADPAMSATCRTEVEQHVQHAAQDYRRVAFPMLPEPIVIAVNFKCRSVPLFSARAAGHAVRILSFAFICAWEYRLVVACC